MQRTLDERFLTSITKLQEWLIQEKYDLPRAEYTEWFTKYIPIRDRTMNDLIKEKDPPFEEESNGHFSEANPQKGEKRKADAMDASSEESSNSSEESSDDEGESEVVYRTVKCPHCKRWVWKVFKFSFKLTILVIAQLISNYLLCNQ
jgi:chromatin remodeling complex protein RSC6